MRSRRHRRARNRCVEHRAGNTWNPPLRLDGSWRTPFCSSRCGRTPRLGCLTADKYCVSQPWEGSIASLRLKNGQGPRRPVSEGGTMPRGLNRHKPCGPAITCLEKRAIIDLVSSGMSVGRLIMGPFVAHRSSHDPDEVVEILKPVAPGVSISPLSKDFQFDATLTRLRATGGATRCRRARRRTTTPCGISGPRRSNRTSRRATASASRCGPIPWCAAARRPATASRRATTW